MSLYVAGIVFDELTSDPGSPEEGQFWYNTTEDRFKVYRNGSVQALNDKAELDAHIAMRGNPHEVSLEEARQQYSTLSGTFSMGGYKITDVGTPSADGDVATWGKVQEHVTNSLNGLDWQNSVLSQVEEDPTSISPSTGDRYIIPSSGTGDWSGKEDQIAEWNGTSWDYIYPNEGFAVHVEDEGVWYNFPSSGTGWVNMGSVVDHGTLQGLSDDDHPQYHNNSRADTWFSGKDTDDLTEGSTNLYYDDALVSANSDVSANTSHRNDVLGNPHHISLEDARLEDNTVSGTIDMGSNKITNVATPTVGGDAVNMTYADDHVAGEAITGTPEDGYTLVYNTVSGTWVYEATTAGSVTGASNVGSTGEGVFKQESGGILQFKNIDAASNKVTVSGTATDEIDIDIVPGNIDHQDLNGAGTNDHSAIDSHISDSTIHFTEGSIDHDNILNNGTYSHSQIDSHIDDTSNPHQVTPAQVQNDISHWNAGKLQGYTVASGVAPSAGQVLTYSGGAWVPQGIGGDGNPGNFAKAGQVLNASFAGSPKTATVSFSTAYSDTNYAISLVAVTTDNASFSPAVENQAAGSFDINVGANNITKLTKILWTAMPFGE